MRIENGEWRGSGVVNKKVNREIKFKDMKNIIVFVSLCVVSLLVVSCQPKLTEVEAINAVMSGEEDRLPLLLQQMSFVDTITIDSMRIRCTDEPMDGYLYTTWTYELENIDGLPIKEVIKSFIIPISNIQTSSENRKYVEWIAGWDDVYDLVKDEMLDYKYQLSLYDFD